MNVCLCVCVCVCVCVGSSRAHPTHTRRDLSAERVSAPSIPPQDSIQPNTRCEMKMGHVGGVLCIDPDLARTDHERHVGHVGRARSRRSSRTITTVNPAHLRVQQDEEIGSDQLTVTGQKAVVVTDENVPDGFQLRSSEKGNGSATMRKAVNMNVRT